LLDGADLKIFRGQVGLEGRGELADVVHGCGILVDGEDLAALAEQVDEVAPVAASGIDDGHAGLDVAAEDLIEDVDVDLAELFLDVDGQWDLSVLRVHKVVPLRTCTRQLGVSSTSVVFREPRQDSRGLKPHLSYLE
jgi:hypothetical protein